jgi:hypothetical protein
LEIFVSALGNDKPLISTPLITTPGKILPAYAISMPIMNIPLRMIKIVMPNNAANVVWISIDFNEFNSGGSFTIEEIIYQAKSSGRVSNQFLKKR